MKHRMKPLRRSKREKRLLFATFNVSQMDKQVLNQALDTDLSEDEMDPYEQLLSPHRVTRNSSRSQLGNSGGGSGSNPQQPPPPSSVASGSATKMAAASKMAAAKEDAENSPKGDSSSEEKATEGDEEEEGEEEPSDQTEDEGGYYNLRKRQPVIYHLKPVHHVVEGDTPPKKRHGRRRRRSLSRHRALYHSKARAAAPRAYQGTQAGHGRAQSPRKRQAHHDSSSTSSDSDSDEAKFRRRKARSMAKARSQCLPMNFTADDLTQGVIRDRIQVGASLADVNPMNVDRSVTFDSVGGLKKHVRALKEMIIFPLLYPEVFERFQISPPRGVLFHGPPGCGKTLVARALANECSKGGKKVAFFMRKGADCLSKWVGESERQLRLLFDQAYQVRPSIIFFDEIDGLAPVRSSRQDQIHSSIVSTLLALMDGLDSRGEIVVIGATNRIDAIDPALRRPGRFDREFIFPLPSREDRHSILSIHTREWNPRLKPSFLCELSDSTVGYCGADLRALCTEAALFALRRKYPQIYSTSERLVLDTSKINVAASDFRNALKSVVPTAQRADGSVALALPEHVRSLYLKALSDLLGLLCFVFPPCWKLVSKAGVGLEWLLAGESESVRKMEKKLEELGEILSVPPNHQQQTQHVVSAKLPRCNVVAARSSSGKKTKSARYSRSSKSSRSKSGRGGAAASSQIQSPSVESWSGDPTGNSHHHHYHQCNNNNRYQSPAANTAATSASTSGSSGSGGGSSASELSNIKQRRGLARAGTPASSRSHFVAASTGHQGGGGGGVCITASSVYNQLFLKHSKSVSMGDVFFDLTDVSSDEDQPSNSSNILINNSATTIATTAISTTSTSTAAAATPPSLQSTSTSSEGYSSLQSTSYLSFSSQPHVPPSVHHPRLVLCGQAGMGQSAYLGPALLHALEDLPVKTMDLTTLFGSSTKTPEEACAQILRELRRVTPSILFLPRLDSWWHVTTDTFQATLLSALSSLLPSTPLLILATAECLWEELPAKLREVFGDVGSQTFTVLPPSLEQRKQFFYEVLLEKPFLPPPSKPKPLTTLPLETLPVASPPRPRELSREEVSRILRQREAVLRELRVFLRDATNKLLAERKFKEFVKPVDPEEVPDYYDIIAQPMDLGTVMKKIDEHRYSFPKEWIADVDLIARNALEYNPECDSESRLLRHRAVALQDMAHSFLDHELSEDFEKQCEDIVESFGRIEKTEVYAQLQLQLSPSLSATPGGSKPLRSTPAAASSASFKSDLLSAPRRSLRQKGMDPEEKGFPYYSPSKQRSIKDMESSEKAVDLSKDSGDDGSDSSAELSRKDDEQGSVQQHRPNNSRNSCNSSDDDDLLLLGRRAAPSANGVNADEADAGRGSRRWSLANSSVRRQIICPLAKGAKGSEPPLTTSDSRTRRNGIVSPPPAGFLEALQKKEVKGLVEEAEEEEGEEPMVVEDDSPKEAVAASRKRERRSVSLVLENIITATSAATAAATPAAVAAASRSPSTESNAQVSIDGAGFLELFERVVGKTEACSVEEMERVHTTYRQLVFRHRMSTDRHELLQDLRLATDLFLQELVRS